MLPNTINRFVKYEFSEEELVKIATEIARKISAQKQLELDKKAAASEFSARINQVTAELRELADNYELGYEYREAECRIYYDIDRGVKYYYHGDMVDPVGQDPLTKEEKRLAKQQILPGMENV